MGLAIRIQNIAKALLPSSIFDLFLWYEPLGGTRRADWHRLSLNTSFHTEFLHQFAKCSNGSASSSIMDTTKQVPDPGGGIRKGITILQVSTPFMASKDAPAHAGSFSRAPALLQRLCTQGRWHRMGCVARGVDWGAEAALVAPSSCVASSHDQQLLLTSHLPIFAENNMRTTQSLDEFQNLNVFADKTKTGQWTKSVGKCHLRVDLDHLLGGISFEQHVFSWSHTESKAAHVKRQ